MRVLLLLFIGLGVMFGLELPRTHVVDTKWLEKNLDNPKLKIIDVRSQKEYNETHIKNAVNVPKDAFFKGVLGNVQKLYTSPEELEKTFQYSGIKKDDIVLFYSAGTVDEDFADGASGVWNAWIYGFENGIILDGGIAKWIDEKRETTKELPVVTKSDFAFTSFKKSDIASIDEILEAIFDDDIQIADARTSKAYLGELHRKDIPRSGRIPTAKLTPVKNLVSKIDNKYYLLLSKKDAEKTLNNNGFGIDLNKPMITYCNTGHKARGVWFVSKFLVGIKNVSVYDGGMVEYSLTNLKIDTGEPID